MKYQSGKTNLAADSLSCCQHNPDSESEEDYQDIEYQTISYSTVCQLMGEGTSGLKLDRELTLSIQEEEGRNCTVKIISSELKVFDSIMPDKMRKAQMEDKDLIEVIRYIEVLDKALSYEKAGSLSHQAVRKYL